MARITKIPSKYHKALNRSKEANSTIIARAVEHLIRPDVNRDELHNVHVLLDEVANAELEKFAKALGCSSAELIRRILRIRFDGRC